MFNFYGLIFVAVIMVPNVIFAIMHKGGFENLYQNKIVEIFEQIGRIGSFIFMFINVPPLVKGYFFNGGFWAYIISGGALTLAYVFGWIVFRRESSVKKSLYLSVVPSLLFLCCGILSLNFPLMASAAVFAPCHVLISYKNAKAQVEKNKAEKGQAEKD